MDHLQLQQQQQHQHRLLQQRQQQQQQQFMNALASTSCSCTHQGAMSYTHYPSHSTHYISKQQCDSQHQYRHQEHHRQSPRSFCHLNQHTLNTNKNNKLSSFNPKPVRKLCFSTAQPSIHFTWPSDQYDRTSDPNTTAHRLSPSLAQKIKIEMNQFKSQEMMVHPDSHVNTHIFV
ncbi:hypothetical protein BCR41DRAFT_354610 [Lobosporangium transversale]|uniref:Uncharacterized protein n=1 Tax=Lobosporangium transversale TaxID=64571 RepID=A0A1Y2GL83_9FUNG|nr:hypothetical protein BCR41DRAFT_354610 [Lobosporangium transversale]ORZ14278.1 hypothetical protein BCR41DRAFT_354610 [Lobosporangium transversale]|eukprot:XP_021880756.1 hypothetical protein BCR41DRAFT_354610 [Lobosporangium transversale]